MPKKDESRAGLLTCSQVRDRIYPLLLRAVSERDRGDVLRHTAACEPCRITLEAVRGRLERIGGVVLADLGAERRAARRPPRRRWWLWLLPAVPAALAYALLIHQAIKVARYRYEQRFLARLEKALYLYKEDFGAFPPANAAPLAVYLSTTEKNGPYLDLEKERLNGSLQFVDHWGSPYLYTQPGVHNPRLFDVQSYGYNARDDGGRGDDIANWEDRWEKIPQSR